MHRESRRTSRIAILLKSYVLRPLDQLLAALGSHNQRPLGPYVKFSARAQRVMSLAQAEALRRNHKSIGTEHILLGLVGEGDSVAARVLVALGVDLAAVRSRAEFLAGHGEQPSPNDIGLTPGAKRVIELAVDEARSLSHHYIGTEHLLIGLMRVEVGVAAGVLESHGVRLDEVRAAAKVMAGQDGEGGREPIAGGSRSPGSQHGGSRFERFSERARRVLSLAQAEAQRFNHNYIGTEHILLGLIREADGVGARVLTNRGADLSTVRSRVEDVIGRGQAPVFGDMGLTPGAKSVIALAVNEARSMGHHYIGTEHLLIGLMREGEGLAAQVLQSLGLTLQDTRAEVLRILGGSRPKAE